VFNRCLDASDPRICQYKLDTSVRRTKKLVLPSAVKELLEDRSAHFSRNILEESSDEEFEEDSSNTADESLVLEAELNPENREADLEHYQDYDDDDIGASGGSQN